MSEALGLAVGATNVTAARPGRTPVSRRSVLTLWPDRPAEMGVPSQNPELTSPNLTAAGVVLRGFVERVGDPVPLVAADGSAHRGEALLATGLEAMGRAVDDGEAPSAVMVAAPAYWGPATIGALRDALRSTPALSPGGVPPFITSDATAAMAALQAEPGLPTRGVVALCDFGGSGSSVTLADAGANLAPIGETLRFTEFSGDQIDQALLNHILAGVTTGASDETSGTAAVGPLTRLREECRLAKERLSTQTATTVPIDLPGHRSESRLTRAELESVIAPSLTGLLDALGDALERNRIPAVNLAAVATVGGGAAIPMISQQLSQALRVPVITSPSPALAAAAGAALLAARGIAPDAQTSIAVAAADAPTSLAPAAWAASTAGQAAGQSASDGSPSATFRALAWSQDDDATQEPVPYAGEDYTPSSQYSRSPEYVPAAADAPPMVEFDTDEHATAVVAPPLPWYRRPALIFGIAAALAAVAVGGLAIKLTDSPGTPTTTTTRVTKPGEEPGTPGPPPPPQTVTVTGSNGQTTVTTVPATTTPAPTSGSPSPSSSTTSTTTPPTTTTTTAPTTTTTTTTPRTVTTSTTTQPPTTTRPPTTTQPPTLPPTTTAPPTLPPTTQPPTLPPTTQPPTLPPTLPPTTAAPQPVTVEPAVTAEPAPEPEPITTVPPTG